MAKTSVIFFNSTYDADNVNDDHVESLLLAESRRSNLIIFGESKGCFG